MSSSPIKIAAVGMQALVLHLMEPALSKTLFRVVNPNQKGFCRPINLVI